ncbi:MAG: hypothetical protein NWF00_12475 [Candidatus Bathyarchaeota archaeon]|nr:hypothetical protein [Candidatus Bathyarchaeota archaeon]
MSSIQPPAEDAKQNKLTVKAMFPRMAPRTDATKNQYVQEYWKNVDNLFYRTIGHAETAFKVNIYINIIVVIIGIVILGYSILYSWINGLNLYSTAFGSLGVVSFIATFYLTPQKRVQKTVGDLTQLQMFYRTYYMQAEAINDWLFNNQKNLSLNDLDTVNKQLEALTNGCVEKIESYIGKE